MFFQNCDTQVVLDCTEVHSQTPNSLLLWSEVFPTYKSHCNSKGLLGMAPHGAITFVSAFNAGSNIIWHYVSPQTNNGHHGRQGFLFAGMCAL